MADAILDLILEGFLFFGLPVLIVIAGKNARRGDPYSIFIVLLLILAFGVGISQFFGGHPPLSAG